MVGVFLLSVIWNLGFAQQKQVFLPFNQLPSSFQKQLKTVRDEFVVAYSKRPDSSMREIRNYTIDEIRNFIYKETDYEKVFRCPFWIALDSVHYAVMIPELINALTDTTYIGLTNAFDVTIWCRVSKGQLQHNTYNYQIDEDIFKVGGRALWILKRLTKNQFGVIRCETKMDDIKSIQKSWLQWLNTVIVKSTK